MIKKTLYFGNPAYLSLRNGQLVIRLPEVEKAELPDIVKQETIRTIPIEDIGVVVLDNKQITMTQGALAELVANSAAVKTKRIAYRRIRLNHLLRFMSLPVKSGVMMQITMKRKLQPITGRIFSLMVSQGTRMVFHLTIC